MTELEALVADVARARDIYLDHIHGIGKEAAEFSPNEQSWSILEVTEHLVHAEDVGVQGIWRALERYQQNELVWQGEATNAAVSIEDVVDKTWQPKEEAPAVAEPRIGGSLHFWAASLRARQHVLESLGRALIGIPLEAVIYPHPISGPLDARQRLAFLRFHIERHHQQMLGLLASYNEHCS